MASSSKSPVIFALLTPDNLEAVRAFSKVVDATLNNPGHYSYHKAFIQSSGSQIPLKNLLRAASSSTDSEEDSKTKTELDALIWTGSYVFSLKILPEDFPQLWRAGSGRWISSPHGDVDFLLSVEPQEDRVRGTHAHFQFNAKSGILMLGAYHSGLNAIKIGNETFGRNNGQRALNSQSTTLRFGKLEYKFCYQIEPNTPLESRYQEDMMFYFENVLKSPLPIEATSATPSAMNITIGPWTLHRPVGAGTFGVVSAASHQTGDIVAVKTFIRRSQQTSKAPDYEIEIVQKVMACDHDERQKYIISLENVLYSSGSKTFKGPGPDFVYLLYTPLAEGTSTS
jgi:hypothetical protein